MAIPGSAPAGQKFALTEVMPGCDDIAMRGYSLRMLVSPLILVFWLGALWACMAPQAHHSSHDGKACTSLHNAIGPQTASKIAGSPAVLPMVVAVFLAMAMILVGFSKPAVDAVPRLQRRRYRPAQPNAPPVFVFLS